ncbi:MAG: LapA family protein [Pseudanabaenaceae cyanobacterium]
MARIGSLILLVLLGLAIAENPGPVVVVILGRALPPWPLGVWMALAFALGAGLGAIARWLWPLRPLEPVPTRPRTEPQPPPSVAEEDNKDDDDLDDNGCEDWASAPRDRPPNPEMEPPILEEDEDEDDEDTYLIARYIRR